jgi:deazaflavin-dependent oxidoreductase (nitroreductase family)
MDLKSINPAVIEEYRRSGGSLTGPMAGLPVLLLTTTGRRSGGSHTVPLGYVQDGAGFVVAASAGGAPADPDWYRNLSASPTVAVEVGADRYRAHARRATGPDRDRLFDRLAATLPGLADYAVSAGREIPVVVLTPERGIDD